MDRNGNDGATSSSLTLAIDIGGSHLKAAVLTASGEMVTERARVATPKPTKPTAVVEALTRLSSPLGAFDRISIGFPGVVRGDQVLTAPNLGTKDWANFALAAARYRSSRRSQSTSIV